MAYFEVAGFATADLAITKTDGVTTATPGGSVTYTITASNAGPERRDRRRRWRTPSRPSLTCTWTCVGAGGGTCTAAGSGNINDTVNLPAGGSVTYTASCTIARVGDRHAVQHRDGQRRPAGVTDPNPANNSATDTDTLTRVGRPRDHQDRRRDDGDAGRLGDLHHHRLQRRARATRTGATVADTFPASLTCTWTCVGAGGGTCTAAGSGNINDTVNLPAGGSVTYTASCTISRVGDRHAEQHRDGRGAGRRHRSRTRPTTRPPTPTRWRASADLAITKTDGVTTATPGGSVTYTIMASNAGPSNATGRDGGGHLPGVAHLHLDLRGRGRRHLHGGGLGQHQRHRQPAGGRQRHLHRELHDLARRRPARSPTPRRSAAPAGVTDPNPANNSATDTDTLARRPGADVSRHQDGRAAPSRWAAP